MSSDSEQSQTRASTPGSSPSDETPPDVLGQYRLIKPLGEGGMGCVYLATDEQLCRTVALKVLRPDFAVDEEARARFFREARAAAALKHDNIVTIYQVGEDQAIPFLAMEHLEGKTLEDWLRPDRRANVTQTISIGKQIARGLSAAHEAGVVHRDIKPANIWLEPKGRVKILDFGIAHHATATDPKLTQPGTVMGTPAFMSPEQARGEALDLRSDLFSFGCVLYRMATGRLPFQAEVVYGVIAAILSEQQISPKTVTPSIPQALSDLIDHLLSKSRDDRPDSAESVLASLKEIEAKLDNETVTTPPLDETISLPKLPKTIADPTSQETRKKAAAMGLVLFLALGGIGLWIASGNSETPSDETSTPEDSTPSSAKKTKLDNASQASTTSAGTKADASEPIDLLKTADVEGALRGVWRRQGDAVFGYEPKKERRFFMLNIDSPIELPENYCLKMRVERGNREDGALLISLMSDSSHFTVRMDSPHPDRPFVYTGFNPDMPKRIGKVLHPRVPVDLVFWVTKDRLKVMANDQTIFSWAGDFANFRRVGISNTTFAIGGAHPGIFRFDYVTLIPNATEPEGE